MFLLLRTEWIARECFCYSLKCLANHSLSGAVPAIKLGLSATTTEHNYAAAQAKNAIVQ
jgi:hypothetical protein